MATKNLSDMFIDLLKDAYSAETQVVEALPRMADAAGSDDLRAGFAKHLEETHNHVKRLEKVGEMLGTGLGDNRCEAMAGLVEEGDEIIDMVDADSDARDAALIAAAQKVEHYEIATYGTLCAWAKQLGRPEAARILHQSLDEEKAADEKLTRIAEAKVNPRATK